MRDEPPEPASELEQEGIPEVEGAYPGEAATGVRWDQVVAPRDQPLAAEELGVTPAEERMDEPLALRVQREEPDVGADEELVDLDEDETLRRASQGVGMAGTMSTGAHAGAGPGGPEDVDAGAVAVADERGEGGPTGSQDSGAGDLAEAGD